jgi:hypothetical protein
MSNAPETAGSWSARRQAARNVGRGVLPEDEPDRSLTIQLARNALMLRWLILMFAILGPVQLLNAFQQDHDVWSRISFAVLGICTLSLAVAMFLRLRGARVVLARVAGGERSPD